MYLPHSEPKFVRWQKRLGQQARKHRLNPTRAEVVLWQELKGRKLLGYKFRRQYAMYNYIADFYCHALKLVVEVDGPIHLKNTAHDQLRDMQLKEAGYTIVRFTNEEVIWNTDEVIIKLTSLLQGGGGSPIGEPEEV